jgi:hypothetical protein
MLTYYIRHTGKVRIDQATRKKLWQEKRVAIHFPEYREKPIWRSQDNSSLNPADYGRGAQQMRILCELADKGGFVCAEHHGFGGCLVGFVPPKSRLDRFRGHWDETHAKRIAILKSITLSKAKVVAPPTSIGLLLGRPQQGTISRWPSAKTRVKDLVNNTRRRASISSLLHPEQEVLCSEFLRSNLGKPFGLPVINHLLTPIGRTMKDVDFVGITNSGQKVLAQVTFANIAHCIPKLEALRRNMGPKTKLVLFCNCEKLENRNDITIVPIREVFTRFTRSRGGKMWLSAVLGRE